MGGERDTGYEDARDEMHRYAEWYEGHSAKERFQRAFREEHGNGCGCKNCIDRAGTEANEAADFASKGNMPFRWVTKWIKGKPKLGKEPNPDYE